MAMHEDLVDLSLFATSPTSDFQFESMDSPSHIHTEYYRPSLTESRFQSQDFQSQRHTGPHPTTDFNLSAETTDNFDFGFPTQRHTTYERSFYDPPEDPVIRPLPRSYTLKPLPPLPPKKLCKPRPSRARADAQSRCIFQRLKKSRSDDSTAVHRHPIQQRRNVASAPQLMLTLPHSTRGSTQTAPQMVWLPDEQMWLVTDQRAQDFQPSPPQYAARDSTRRQPSPSIYSENTPPLTPDLSSPHNPLTDDDGLSPIQIQFRSLVVDQERRSPLFQEAMQAVEDFNPTRASQQHQASPTASDDDDGWPVDEDGWPIYDPRMYESPIETLPPDLPSIHAPPSIQEDPVSPESPHTPDSSFDEIEREWNSAVSVYSVSHGSLSLSDRERETEREQLHSRDTSDQSYHSAVSSLAWGMDEDPVDFYLGGEGVGLGAGGKPLWHGIARSISAQTGRR